VQEFHEHNCHQAEKWPLSFINASTHDTKRSEDVRMRIHALSEMPHKWHPVLYKWARWNRKFKVEVNGTVFPDRNTEYFIYQSCKRGMG